MSNVKKCRESNIELLRILSMIGVIVLRCNKYGFNAVTKNSANYFVLYFLESLFVCAVNLFILICGYFMCTSKSRGIMKPFRLIVQVIVYKLLFTISGVVLGHKSFSIKSLIMCLIPNNYFVILYITLYFVSVYMNLIVHSLSKKQFKLMLLVLVIIFSVWNTTIDIACECKGGQGFLDLSMTSLSTVGMKGSVWGYSIVNFMLMYLIGSYIRLHIKKKQNIYKLVLALLVLVLVIMAWAILNTNMGCGNGNNIWYERSAWSYCNPLVIAEAVIVFLIFKSFKMNNNKIINNLARGAFSVFLSHVMFLGKIHIEQFVTKNVFIMVGHIVVAAIGLYLCGYIIHVIYDFITTKIFKWLDKYLERFKIQLEFKVEVG